MEGKNWREWGRQSGYVAGNVEEMGQGCDESTHECGQKRGKARHYSDFDEFSREVIECAEEKVPACGALILVELVPVASWARLPEVMAQSGRGFGGRGAGFIWNAGECRAGTAGESRGGKARRVRTPGRAGG